MSKEDLIEKAVKHQPGDVHPKYPDLTWQQNKSGKWTWLTDKTRKKTSQAGGQDLTTKNQPQQQQNNQSQQKPQQSEMPDVSNMTHKELIDWAKETKEKVLLSVANNKSAPINIRQIAYDTLKDKNVDVSKIDVSDIDTGFNSKAPKIKYKSAPRVEIKLPTTFKVKDKNGKTKTLSSSQQAKLYEGLDDAKLLKILNSPTLPAEIRHIAYVEAASRGIDESKIKTEGSLQRFWDKQEQLKNITNQSQDDDDDESYSSYTQPWLEGFDTEKFMRQFPNNDQGWRDASDHRVQKEFNGLKTLSDRQRYDAFLDQQKRQDENYVSPIQQIQDLNADYLEFLDGNTSSFLIASGGAGIGKSWGFKKLCELLDLQKFDPKTMSPGDDDYDWVIAPNIKSENQLNEFLEQHNGKIILFDDNDDVLKRQNMKAVMKTVNDPDPESRLFKDPKTGQMIKFTGKIACITNKSLDELASTGEDAVAVLSRAQILEVKLTVEENLEILGQRYKDMEIDGLNLGSDEAKLREEAYQFILDNKDKLDPAKFTVRKFRNVMLDIQKSRRRNKFSATSSMASSLVGSGRDWRKTALTTLNKAEDDELNKETKEEEFGEKRPTQKVKDKIEKLKKKNPKLANQLFGDAAADHFDDTDMDESDEEDNDDETEKAYQIDFGDMSLKDAENLLLS